VDATVTSNNKQAGELDGKYVADRLGGKGQVVIVNGPPVSAVTDRVGGFVEVMKKYPEIKILSQDQNAWGSRDGGFRVMTDLLTAFPRLDAVFAINDPTAIGCDAAAKQAQRKDLFIVGVDGAPDVVSYLKNPNSLIAASAAENPYAIAGKAVEIGYDIMNGKKADESLTLIPVALITRENIDQYKGWGEPTPAPTPTATPESTPTTTPAVRPATKPEAKPIEKDPRVVSVLYATDRVLKEHAAGNSPNFSFELSATLTFGSAAVRVPENHRYGHVERPGERWFLWISTPETERPRDHFTLRDLRVLTKDEFVQFIRDSGTSSALLFVHGFDTSFEDAIFQLAQITWDTQYAGVPIAFSWPSKGNIDPLRHPDQALLAYNYDKDSARYSQGAFLDVLHLLQTSAHVSKVYIVAHSMGNQIVVNAIDQANYRGEEHFLTEVILAAPEVDWDTFKLSGPMLVNSANGVTLYAFSADKALRFSVKWNGENRAGFIPKTGPLTFPGIETVDVTAAGDDMLGINHDVYRTTRSVLDDIGQILMNGKHPPDSRSTEVRGYPEGSKPPLYWIFPK